MTKHRKAEDSRYLEAADKLKAGVPISIKEWCALEGVSREGWYQHARRGEAPAHYYNGGLVRIAAADYRSWQEARKADAEQRREAAEAASARAPAVAALERRPQPLLGESKRWRDTSRTRS